MTDVAQLIEDLRERAPSYFAEFNGQPVEVELRSVKPRWSCCLYRFALSTPRAERSVIVKFPMNPRSSDDGLDVGRDRPRLKPLTDTDVKYQFEFEALSAIDEHFRAIGDPRFGSVRMFDRLTEHRAIVMEEVQNPILRDVIFRASYLRPSRPPGDLTDALRNAGAWLRAYHQLPALDRSRPRLVRREQYVEGVVRFTEYLARRIRSWRVLGGVLSTVPCLAHQALPRELPLGTGHGDYAPRNIFVGPGSRVTVFDTLARWQVPVYEDVSTFLVALNTSNVQLCSQSLWYSRSFLDACERTFLDGYFAGGEIPWSIVRHFELQALMNRWASLVHARESSRGWRHVAQRLRLIVINRPFALYAQRLLNQIHAHSPAKLNSWNRL